MPDITLSFVEWIQSINSLIKRINKTCCQGQESKTKYQITKELRKKEEYCFTTFRQKGNEVLAGKKPALGSLLFVRFGVIFLRCVWAFLVHVTSTAFEMYCQYPIYVILPKDDFNCFSSRQSCRKSRWYILQSNYGALNTEQKLRK